ncbi:hypothetical protein IF188_12670 [Microbacterium sp. NEAU-LLC]|uniref:Alpha-amylase n=1 Tax=Microbacterium helvum TaxID=2773713 RepID=A0ABR8NU24_9MICO|nr:hypothetical protein [Microbacterium helvum]MBD3942551.1 hypothetical protein [Microbacterium helvum]
MSTTPRARSGALISTAALAGLLASMVVATPALAEEPTLPTGSITGSVHDVVEAAVDAAHVELFALVDGAWMPEPTAETTTDVNGDYAFDAVAEGTYAVRAAEAVEPSDFLPTWYPSTETMPAVDATDGLVIVEATPVDDIDIVLVASSIEATVLPQISGTAQVGATLTATDGEWNVSGLSLSRQWFRGTTAVAGATGTTYALGAADLGQIISVTVSVARDGFGSAAVSSAPTAAVAAGTISGATPTVSGTPTVGTTLTARPGTWTSGTTIAYQWLRNGVAISGAINSTYKLTATDATTAIAVRVTGTKSGYTTVTKTSAATLKVATVGTPKVTGTYTVGETLTATAGTWTSSTSFAFQWLRDGNPISGATASSYKLTSSDNAKVVTVQVTGTKAGYPTVVRTSATSVKTVTAATPKVSGTLAVGQKLTATTGTWTSGTTLAYQWLRNGKAITGATKSTYSLTSTDVGTAISVKVTGTQPGFATISKTSSATLKVQTAPRPTVSGSMVVGTTLTAKPGTWTTGATLSYRWLRDGTAITGATKSTYTLTSGDSGRLITVRVTGTKSGYATIAQISANTTRTMLAATPTITGITKVGSTLTAKPGTWTSGTTFTYVWLRDGASISGATSSTYKLTASDRDKHISVKVTGRQSGVTTATRTSSKTAAIAAGTLTTSTPTISGTRRVAYTLTAKAGTWGPGTVSLKYQWYRSGTAITNATKSTYKLGSGDIGRTITVKVTGSKSGYTTASKTSAPTGTIAKATWYGQEFGVFTTRTISGYGNDIVSVPAGVRTGVITADFDGGGNFIVVSLDSSYEYQDLLFNEIAYSAGFTGATVYGDVDKYFDEPTSYFEIEADGAWTIKLSAIDTAKSLPGSAYGPGVYKYDGGTRTVGLSYYGEGNFIVEQYYKDSYYGTDWDLIVNEIGATSGNYALHGGPSIIVITADEGAWQTFR